MADPSHVDKFLKDFADALQKSLKPLQDVADAAKALTDAALAPLKLAVDTLQGTVNGLAAAFKAPLAVIDSFTSSVSGLVAAAAPGTMIRFQMAMQDLMASLGVIFEPIIEAGTQLADVFNRVFTEIGPTLVPIIRQLSQVIVQVGTVIANALRPVLAALAPVLETVVGLFTQLVPVIEPVITAVGGMFADLLRALQPLLIQAIPYLVQAVTFLANVFQEAILHIRTAIRNPRSAAVQAANLFTGAAATMQGADTWQQIVEMERRRIRMELAAMPPLPANQMHAARPASQIGIEEIGLQARAAAFGSRSLADIQAEALANLQQIAQNTGQISDALAAQVVAAGQQAGGGLNGINAAMAALWGID